MKKSRKSLSEGQYRSGVFELSQAIVTVVTRDYMHYALTLAQQSRIQMPGADFFVVVADDLDDQQVLAIQKAGVIEGGKVLRASEFSSIANWKKFAFQYTPFELSCALKPFSMLELVRRGYSQLIYIDADIGVYAPLVSIVEGLKEHPIILTPHLVHPFPRDGRIPSEGEFLRAGTFNGGIVACRGDQEGAGFLEWWKDCCTSDCYVDIAKGMFVDQKWLNLVPGLFPQAGVVRNPGCNTGHWTLSQFPISGSRESGYLVGEEVLQAFHFSNFLPRDPLAFMRGQNRFSYELYPALKQLVDDYHASIRQQDSGYWQSLGCTYKRLSDGTPIRPEWREAIRRGHPNFLDVVDPFEVQSNSKLISRFRKIERKAIKWRGDWQLGLLRRERRKQRQRFLKSFFRWPWKRK